MTSDGFGLNSSQNAIVEEFLHLFGDVEKALKAKLRRPVNDRTGFGSLVSDYAAMNPYWAATANHLRNFADIRNLLTHQRSTTFGYPIAVTPALLKLLREIKDQLLKPEPVSARFRRTVTTVSPEDSLATVLSLAFEKGFSQFPVNTNGRFGGLITENEIIRWLGRQSRSRSVEVNLAAVNVKTVIKEQDPYLKGISIFHFEKLESPVDEVIGRFSSESALEVILLTASGNSRAPIEGIVTQWDAARYRS